MRNDFVTKSSGVSHYLLALFLFAYCFPVWLMALPTVELDKLSREEITERIRPSGGVCVTGEECEAHTSGTDTLADTGPQTADSIYNGYCTACHTIGVLGAPKKGDTATWQKHLKVAGSYKNMLANAINGIKAMPPKGGCMDCTEEEISSTIQFMSGLKP